jgi:hypothetical protein
MRQNHGHVSFAGSSGVCNHTQDDLEMTSGKGLRLGALSFASLILYLLLAYRYPLASSLDNPRATWASMVGSTWLNAIYHILIYIGLFLIYVLILRFLSTSDPEDKLAKRRQTRLISVTWLVCSSILLFAAPAGESHDVFDYLFRGRMMTEYQANPLVEVPNDFNLSTPFSRYLAWRKNVDTYGPVWELSSKAIASGVHYVTDKIGWWDESYPVCPHSPQSCRLLIVYITSYRLLAIVLTGISGWLIYKIVENTHSHLAPMALAAWLLSPLTLITTAVGGHNDAVMLVFMILSWWFLQSHRPILAILALIMGAHVKLTALIWLPTSILWIIWRWGWKRALKICLISLTIGVVISWLLYKPFGGWGTLPQMLSERAKFLANSFWRILYHQLNYRWGWTLENARQLSTRLSSLLAAAGAFIVPLWMFNFRPQRWRREETVKTNKEVILWQSLASVSMVTLLIGTFWFQHWYILWALAPAVLLPNSRLTRSTLPWLAFGALSSNVVMSFLVETLLKTSPRISKYISEVVIIWGPVFIVSIIYLLLQWRGKRKSVMPIQQP